MGALGRYRRQRRRRRVRGFGLRAMPYRNDRCAPYCAFAAKSSSTGISTRVTMRTASANANASLMSLPEEIEQRARRRSGLLAMREMARAGDDVLLGTCDTVREFVRVHERHVA